ncbi:MAG: RHS repeat-associated core domain-containing protein [Candidatus Hydrogenedentota bacterium]
MFTGHQWDGGSGLYYAPHRYYSPFQARWTTRDPLGMADGPRAAVMVRIEDSFLHSFATMSLARFPAGPCAPRKPLQ